MNQIYYLRTRKGLDVIRITPDAVSRQENDFNHAEWSLDPSSLPEGMVNRIHEFCAAQSIGPLDWSVMATRRF